MAAAHIAGMTTIRLVAGRCDRLAGCYAQQPSSAQYPEPMQYSGPPGGEMDPSTAPTEAQYEQDSQPPQQQAVPRLMATAPQATRRTIRPGAVEEPVPAPIRRTRATRWARSTTARSTRRSAIMGSGSRSRITAACGVPTPRSWAWISHPTRRAGVGMDRLGLDVHLRLGLGLAPVPLRPLGAGWTRLLGLGPRLRVGPGLGRLASRRRLRRLASAGARVSRSPRPASAPRRSTITAPDRTTRSGGLSRRNDFGKGHIRPHLYNDLAEGLRVTAPVMRPPLRGTTQPIRVASTMSARLANPIWRQQHAPAGGWRQPVTAHQPGPHQPQQWGVQRRQRAAAWPPHASRRSRRGASRSSRRGASRSSRRGSSRSRAGVSRRAAVRCGRRRLRSIRCGRARRPRRDLWWNAPTYGGSTYTRPTYGGGSTYTRPTYSPPSRPSYSPPSHSWSAPSAPTHYSGGGGYSAPSHSSGGYSGGSHSSGGYSGGSHSSGGGGGHRR